MQQETPALVQQVLCDWLLRICNKQCLVVEVDDAERADENSLWVLAALAQCARSSRLAVVVAIDKTAACAAPDAVAAVRRNGTALTLGPLDAEQTMGPQRA